MIHPYTYGCSVVDTISWLSIDTWFCVACIFIHVNACDIRYATHTVRRFLSVASRFPCIRAIRRGVNIRVDCRIHILMHVQYGVATLSWLSITTPPRQHFVDTLSWLSITALLRRHWQQQHAAGQSSSATSVNNQSDQRFSLRRKNFWNTYGTTYRYRYR